MTLKQEKNTETAEISLQLVYCIESVQFSAEEMGTVPIVIGLGHCIGLGLGPV